MKTRTKIIGTLAAAILLVTASIFGTMAYLTSTDEVKNTFTVGSVDIKLDEAKANADGTLVSGGGRVQANEYKLIPGGTYAKDPMVTVLGGSEDSYVRMTMTISKATELNAIFNDDIMKLFEGYDGTTWINKRSVDDTDANTRTYEFWYKDVVSASTDTALDPLFDKVVIPGALSNDEIATIQDMTITVNAYAIQAEGFEGAEEAWAAFDAN